MKCSFLQFDQALGLVGEMRPAADEGRERNRQPEIILPLPFV
jgi:hypothetical protein